ncbi:MAG: hypothetical protein HYZ39_04720 [Mycolicibacterium cosmeticum]|nr:hypothetical protein [Mycolicibacterium cosmeticum]
MGTTSTFGDHGGAQSVIAHSLIYVLTASLLFRVGAWFGMFTAVSLAFNVTLVICWAVAFFHRRRDHLCARCMQELPADATTQAERRRPLLRFSHFATTVAGTAAFAAVVFVPMLVADLISGHVSQTFYIPGDLWISAVIYCEWVHHRLRPWCRYCRPWDDEGDKVRAPEPTDGYVQA